MLFCDFLDVWLHLTRCCTGDGSSVKPRVVRKASNLLNQHYERDSVAQTTQLRAAFVESDVELEKPVHHHTHGLAASVRSTASHLIDAIAGHSGLSLEMVQGSAADIRAGRNISRQYYWAKDLMAEPCDAIESDLCALVDVDYYVDMNKRLLTEVKPHLLYTFQPSTVARDEGDYRFTFTRDGQVKYTVSGGATYQHYVWNWDGDCIRVIRRIFGFPYQVVTYVVERRCVDEDHSLILLAPLKSYRGFMMSWIATKFLSAKELRRLNPVDGDFTRLYVNGRRELTVSTGKVDSYISCNVPASVDSTIAVTKETLSTKLTLYTVRSKLSKHNKDEPLSERGVEVLHAYHVRGCGKTEQVSVVDAVRRYQYLPGNAEADLDAKPTMVGFMQPLIHACFAPDKCFNTDVRAAQSRVEKLKTPDMSISAFVQKCMTEFIMKFVGENYHSLHPYDDDVVYERQNRPTQRHILDQAQHDQPNDKALVFVKAEAYSTANDPRMISTICGPNKLAYSTFIYPVADLMKKLPWYAFGKTPQQIALRVSEICQRSDWVDLTDFSRMDGRVNNVARTLERQLMYAIYAPEYRQTLALLMRSQCAMAAVTSFGYKYNTGMARASGSPETSAFNTILSAFTCYMSYRRNGDGLGGYMQVDEAWDSLGIYGGDDGLSGNMVRRNAERSARSVGQVLDLVRIERGNLGVKFLSRHYGPDVWFGDTNSCCDIVRQLSKFHSTARLPSNVTPARKLAEKAFAFCLTDAETPVIGPLVVKANKLFPLTAAEFTNLIGMWNVELDSGKQYYNAYDTWMDDLLCETIPTFDMDLFMDWLDTCDATTIFTPPLCAEKPPPKVKDKVLVDGDLYDVEPTRKSPPKQRKGMNPPVAQGKVMKRRSRSRNRKTKPKTSPAPAA